MALNFSCSLTSSSSILDYLLHVILQVDGIVLLAAKAGLNKSVVKYQVNSTFRTSISALISFICRGIGASQLDVISLPCNVLAIDLVHAVVHQLHGVGVGEQLVTGENILVDLHD